MSRKIASIVGYAPAVREDGSALTYSWKLFCNDNGGQGFWHGGKNFPRHCSEYRTEQAARDSATSQGYEVTEVSWM